MLLVATTSERCDCGSTIPAGGAWLGLSEDGGDKGMMVVHAQCVACALAALGIEFQDARLHNATIKTFETRLDAIEKHCAEVERHLHPMRTVVAGPE